MSDSDSSSYYDDEFGRTREAIDREESEHGTPAADPEPAAAVSDRAGSSPSSAASRDGPAAAPAGTLLAGLQQVQQDPERHPLPADEFARKRDEASRSWATGPPTPAPASHTPPHTHAHHLRRRSSVGTTLRGSSTLSGDTGGAPCRRDPLLGISPDLEVADGFSAKVYGELLQAKKEVQLLVKEREALAAAARRLDKDLGAAEKRRRRAAAGWGAAAAAAADADSAASSLGPRHPLRARRGRAGKAGVVTAFAAACALVAIVVVRTGRHYAVVPPLQRAIYAANTTRTLACKQRLAGMMSELTQLCDTARLLKSKRGYRHFGKLDQTASALQARADELRRVRREMSAPRVTSASDVASLQQYIDEQAAVIEQVKRECRRHQAAGRAHRDAAAALAAGVEHQREARDRLSRKVAETRQAIAEKKRSYPEAELRLTDRLRLLETETRTNLSETAQLAREEDEEVEGLRKEVAHASALVQSGEQDLLEKEALVLRLTEALAARRADAPDARPARAAGAHRMEAEIRFESMRAEETRAHDEKMTALRGRLGGLEAEAGTLRATLAHEAADHASRLKDLAERASNRRDVLVSALHGGIAGGGGGKSEPARRDSPVVPGSPVPPAFSSTFPPPGGDGEDAVEQEIAVGGALGAAVCSDVVSLSSGSNHRAATDEPEGDVPDAAKRGGGEIQRSEAGDQTQQRSEEERAAFDGSEAPTVVPQAALSPITRAETTPADRSLASDESGHDGSYKTVTTVQRRATPVLPADADSDPSNAPQPAAPAAARSRSSNSSFEVFEDSDDDIAI